MFGGKNGAGVYQQIINLMPPHDTYIEAFLGSGAVMRRKAPAEQSIGIDMDKEALRDFTTDYSVALLLGDAITWLRDYTPADQTLIYCDPPYVQCTRTGHDRYRFEMTDGQHEELCTVLAECARAGCQVMLSGYRNSIYERMLAEWRTHDYQAMTRGGLRDETIWMNFAPGPVHDPSYAGDTYIKRQQIKRKAARWRANYLALPVIERQAILAAMLADPE